MAGAPLPNTASTKGQMLKCDSLRELKRGKARDAIPPSVRRSARQLVRAGRDVPLEERRADDLAMLESMQCTAEMIAEQQAALDAASE